LGGSRTVAAGDYSVAAGRRAKAIHKGSFVLTDSTDADFASSGNGQFLVRAAGGVGIGKANPARALDVNGTVTAIAFTGSGTGLTGLDGANLAAGSVTDTKLALGVAVPVGGVIMWWGTVSSVPAGFELCDGQFPTTSGSLLQGRKPDLTDRFVKGP